MRYVHITLSSDSSQPPVPGFVKSDRKVHFGTDRSKGQGYTGPLNLEGSEVSYGQGIPELRDEEALILLESRCEDSGASAWEPVGDGWYVCGDTYTYKGNLAAWTYGS